MNKTTLASKGYLIAMLLIVATLLYTTKSDVKNQSSVAHQPQLNHVKNSQEETKHKDIFFRPPQSLFDKVISNEITEDEYQKQYYNYTAQFCPEQANYANYLNKKLRAMDLESIKNATFKKRNKTLHGLTQSFMQNEVYMNALKRRAERSDECGIRLNSILYVIYSNNDQLDAAENIYNKIEKIAETGNPFATVSICTSNTYTDHSKSRITYCMKIINDESDLYTSKKTEAKDSLIEIYLTMKDVDGAFSVLKKHDGVSTMLGYSIIKRYADSAYADNNNDRFAFAIYNKLNNFNNDPEIKFQLAYMYINGYGTKANPLKAIDYYNQLINMPDFSNGQIFNNIGVAYQKLRRYPEAFKYYLKSAELNDPWGEKNLAQLYLSGHGTLQDYEEAFAWASLAAANDFNDEKSQNSAINLKTYIQQKLFAEQYVLHNHALSNAKALAKRYYKRYVIKQES